jgi:hypothetical protein
LRLTPSLRFRSVPAMFHRPFVDMLQSSIALATTVLLAGAACGGGGDLCVHDQDCPSHYCLPDGTCGPAQGTDAGGSNNQIDAAVTDAPAETCTPTHDGTITASEMPLQAGRSATFRTATNVTIDTAGSAGSGGTLTWDLSGQLSGDADDVVTLLSPAGTWWGSDFGSASYAVTLSASSDLLGVFEVTDSAVLLLGVVSPDATGGTELTYSPPAELVAMPFSSGNTWTSTSTVSGTASGVAALYNEEYDSDVDATGTMTTPYGAFPVLRVATNLTRTSGVTTLATSKTFAWDAECFGAVATIVSQDFETQQEFTDAAEVQRLAP